MDEGIFHGLLGDNLHFNNPVFWSRIMREKYYGMDASPGGSILCEFSWVVGCEFSLQVRIVEKCRGRFIV